MEIKKSNYPKTYLRDAPRSFLENNSPDPCTSDIWPTLKRDPNIK